MQENHVFEYAVIRVVPRAEREEFLNVGVILYCPKQKFLKAIYKLDKERLKAFYQDIDLDELEQNLCSFKRISNGSPNGGPIAKLDIASRFRWLTATRSTVVQTSKVHIGLCGGDAMETLNKLYNQLVL